MKSNQFSRRKFLVISAAAGATVGHYSNKQ
ncbi:MAG: twin-arginine translocation signal domain-containing protein [Acidobacteriota bacterium]|nr:twin-arginine translocation signal domain-containing protein [Acidobacteriota bacterium]